MIFIWKGFIIFANERREWQGTLESLIKWEENELGRNWGTNFKKLN